MTDGEVCMRERGRNFKRPNKRILPAGELDSSCGVVPHVIHGESKQTTILAIQLYHLFH